MGKTFPIVAIGASAGGVEALSKLFSRLPPAPGAGFVVVTHLAPHRESLLPQILARHTAMNVETAGDGTAIEPNHVYLNTPDGILTMRDGLLRQEPRNRERNAVDVFFSSLAMEAGERLVAVILSGTGHDGAIGIKAIREAGGLTLAQDGGDGTIYHGMPDAALATGFVDLSLPVDQLADRIVEFITAYTQTDLVAGQDDSVEQAKKDIYSILQDRVGHDFSHYKDKTFLRRVERRMHVRQITDLPTYVQFLKTEAEEAPLLFRDLLIGVTSFFRDEKYFEVLAKEIIPRLFDGKKTGDPIRIWVPGCATGEEAYSIAMLMREAMANAPAKPKVQIFASDIDDNALTIARAGRYPAQLLESLPPERLERHFVRNGNTYQVSKELRELCMFSSHNIIRDPPFSKMDLISCRNLLIYFDADLQRQVIPVFHYALKPGGYLFLGASENVSKHADLFEPVNKKHRIFQRRSTGNPPHPVQFSNLPGGKPFGARAATVHPIPAEQDSIRHLKNRIFEAYCPAHVLLDEDWGIIHYSTRTGKYFEAPAGAPSRALLATARKALRMPLRSALHEAMDTLRPATRLNVSFDLEGRTQSVDITVELLPEIDGHRRWMVVFNDVRSSHADDSGAEHSAHDEDSSMLQLERELQQTRDRLQTSIEDYETSVEELKSANEELLSMNEELQSFNEELETSREELQSLNEEMYTVNSEMVCKVEELDQANSDLRNLFDSTQIATAFLDRNFIIRNFTPAMADVFKLIPSDCGRSLLDIVSLIDNTGMTEDYYRALETGLPVERNVSRLDGTACFLLRIVPYVTNAGQMEGGIMTFVNVTEMVQAEEHQRMLVAELNHRVKNMLAVVASMAGQMARRYTSPKEFATNFIDRIQGLAKTHDILSSNEWSDITLAELLRAELDAFIGNGKRAIIDGPEVRLTPRAATTLGIVLHELATNALKYGALGESGGKLRVEWRFEGHGGVPLLVLSWRESDGPPVYQPAKTGLGTELIDRSLDYELGGTANMEYRPDGIIATLTIPVTDQNFGQNFMSERAEVT